MALFSITTTSEQVTQRSRAGEKIEDREDCMYERQAFSAVKAFHRLPEPIKNQRYFLLIYALIIQFLHDALS
jgi:hypothetical protein